MENEIQEIEFSRFLENYEIYEDEIYILLSDLGGPEDGCAPEDFKISLGGEILQITGISDVEKEQIPATVYCLVDVSGSMKEEQMNQVKETLLAIRSSMTAEDNMVICTMGNETRSSGFLQAGEELDQVIQSLEAGNEDTNLYKGIVDSIRLLQTDQKVHAKRCLLILSDGDDEQVSGITEQEAKQAVMDSKIPVYTVATLRQSQNEEQLEYAKLLGSFSRLSVGGRHYAPMIDGRSAEETGTSVMQSLKAGVVVSAGLPADGTAAGKDVLLLRVVYEAGNDRVLEDTVDVYTEELPVSELEEEPSEEAAEEPVEPEEEVLVTESSHNGVTLLFPAVGAAVLLVCAVLLILRSRRRNRKGYWNAASSGEEAKGKRSGGAPKEQGTEEETVMEGGLRIELKAMGGSGSVYPLVLAEGQEMIFGRNQYADLVLDPDDLTISGTHCRICNVKGRVMLKDLQSKNGTLVNGTPVREQGTVELQDGDVLKIGHTRYEFRITEDH